MVDVEHFGPEGRLLKLIALFKGEGEVEQEKGDNDGDGAGLGGEYASLARRWKSGAWTSR